jgi:hypothetical protein
MNTNKIGNGLFELGFNSGWVVSGDEIVLWEHNVPKPSMTKILEASEIWDSKQIASETEAQAKRQALLDKLGITEDEARLLLGGN